MIISWLKDQYPSLSIQHSIEEEPLGTGGAIRLACKLASEKTVYVLNGDTIFNVELKRLGEFHQNHEADCTLSLKPMIDFDRYGVVELNQDMSIASFTEKQQFDRGLINGGVYALNISSFMEEVLPVKFSFEKDYLEKFLDKRKIFGMAQDKYFIDIGVPEDYERANLELG